VAGCSAKLSASLWGDTVEVWAVVSNSMMSARGHPRIRAYIRSLSIPRPPRHIRQRFRAIAPDALERIAISLKENYFAQPINCFAESAEAYLALPEGKKDLEDHLHDRLDGDRVTVVPWLDQARRLQGARVLEIGCGTGSATVAIAEQGALVTAVDVEPSIEVARERCKAYGLDVAFSVLNAAQAASAFSGEHFDFIIFYASLEHMTHEERLAAMKGTWDMLPKGSFWCVVQAPNRLWYRDDHTSLLPFFLWLPNDLAFEYSRFSPRKAVLGRYREHSREADLDFLRKGRGVSFHEFDLALKPSEDLKVVSSLLGFLRGRSILWRMKAQFDGDTRFESLLRKWGPRIHPGFYQQDLGLIIQKD
jgi:SAM-dependent methyltransferase